MRETRNFATKTAARLLALKREAEIVKGAAGALPRVTLREAVQRYMREAGKA
ncbi:MAG: hypothetical protein IJM64_03590 [Ottowia sp.]|nr:hypothetical protein [Ottowia sp.]